MIGRLRERLSASGLTASRKGILSLTATLVARALAALGGIYFSMVIARVGGAEGLGVTTFVLSLMLIAALLLRFGTDQSLIRLAASYRAVGRSDAALPILLKAAGVCFALAAGAATVIWLVAPSIASGPTLQTARLLVWALPPLTIVNVASGYLKGMRFSAVGALSEFGAISGVSALTVTIANIGDLIQALQVVVAVVWFTGAGAILACLIVARHQRSDEARDRELGRDSPTFWRYLVGGYPFTIIGLSLLATQTGSFAIGGFVLSDYNVGQLRAAERIAMTISFALTAIAPFIAPRLSAAWTRSGGAGVRAAYRKAVLASLLTALPVALVVVVLGRWLLAIFGPEFTGAYPLLLIMGVGQLTHACMGSLNTVVAMTGRERESMWISLFALVLGSLALWLASLTAGAYGFAVAYSVTIVARELAMLAIVRRIFTEEQS